MKVLALEHGVEQVAVGTVYKDMKLKPTALKEYTEDVTMAQQLAADTFCDDEDGLVLEDETARIKLTGRIDVGCLVTGIIIGVRGVLDEKAGVFVVEEQCFAGETAKMFTFAEVVSHDVEILALMQICTCRFTSTATERTSSGAEVLGSGVRPVCG